MSALYLALLGAESSGKSSLAQALQQHLSLHSTLRVARVDEYLREWCEQAGRTPQPHEQAAIAQQQHERMELAGRHTDLVLCDTTPLMTAIYSELLFQDASLYPMALAVQARMDMTLVMALDLPWVADGQRDGPHMQAPVDQALRRRLRDAGLPYSVVSGQGVTRLQQALHALGPLLRGRLTPRDGLFSRLLARQHALGGTWRCEHCDDPDCELASLQAQ
jgi:nicotinamide riboside kinase